MIPTDVDAASLGALAEIVETACGLRFSAGRRSELLSKTAGAFAASGCRSWSEYLAHLRTRAGQPLLDRLIEALTIGETYFFRHQAYFDALEHEALPALMARNQDLRRLRIWCAGCATGEEAYSIAIMLHRMLPRHSRWHVSILGTDLNHTFLAQAEAGLYGEWSFRGTDAAFKLAYFTREEKRYRIRPEIRQMVSFARLNLTENVYPSSATQTNAMDLILCRNVLIYFSPRVCAEVAERLAAALAPGGWLVLGPSDPVSALPCGLVAERTAGAVLYRRPEVMQPAAVNGPEATKTPARPAVHRHPFGAAGIPTLRRDTDPPCAAKQPPAIAKSSVEVGSAEAAAADWQTAWRAARLSANHGDLAQAESHCQNAITHASRRPEPYYLLGTLREAQGDVVGALHAFRQSLYLDRAFVPAHLALAANHQRAGNRELAEQAIGRARKLLVGQDSNALVLAEDGLTVGRLLDVLDQIASNQSPPEHTS